MILKELKIHTWVGDATNCYVIFDEESKEIMCIDPAGDVDKIENLIKNKFDLTPNGIIKYLELEKPIYSKTTNYGHFGKNELKWEEIIEM